MPDHRPPGTPSRSVFARPLGGRSFSPVLALLLKPLRLRMRSRASTPVILIFEISTLHRSSAEDEKNNTRFQHSRQTIAGLVFCSCEQESGANLVRKRQRKAAAGRGESARSSEKARARLGHDRNIRTPRHRPRPTSTSWSAHGSHGSRAFVPCDESGFARAGGCRCLQKAAERPPCDVECASGCRRRTSWPSRRGDQVVGRPRVLGGPEGGPRAGDRVRRGSALSGPFAR